MKLLSLPEELLEAILLNVHPKDLISLSRTCKKLNNIAQRDELWAAACLNKFGITIHPSKDRFAQRLCKSLLLKYGNLLGFWRKPSSQLSQTLKDCYGGLLQVMYSDGEIIGCDLLPPKDPYLMEPLRPKKLFSISMNEADNDRAVIKCYCKGTQLLTISCKSKMQNVHDRRQNMLDQYHDRWLEWLDEQVDTGDQETMHRITSGNGHFWNKFSVIVDRAVYLVDNVYRPLEFPISCKFVVPIQPGFFKGSYSDCGIQLVKLAYSAEGTAICLKTTGDKNSFAGYITFAVNLRFCTYLNGGAQATMELVEPMNVPPSNLHWSELPSPQPFILPEGCNDRYLGVPNQCKVRFQGSGFCIGSTFNQGSVNFSGSMERKKGHWIVFDEDLFGFLWISSRKFSLFHRIQDPSLQVLKKN